ncbi:MAG: glycosyltransferase [Acidobacteriota bacterium]|nr:glycosyltransferase [Acidobacteriota bacterium]
MKDPAAAIPGAPIRVAPIQVAAVMPGVGVFRRGAEAFVVDLCAALDARPDFQVTLFCRGPAPVPHRRIRALPRDRRWLETLYGATRLGRKILDTFYLDPLNLEWASASLSAFPSLWRGGYDVVIMEGGLVGAWLCRLLRRLKGIPFVDIAHGNSPRWEGAFARQHPDRVVCFTDAAAAMIRERAPRAAIQVIPHGVDLQLFQPGVPPAPAVAELGLSRPIVLAAGAVDEHKRFHLAAEAVARLSQPHEHASLVVLGDGPAASELDRHARALLGEGRYHRTSVPREEMPAWYAAADAFTLPSLTEAFGLVYLEAMACGIPCVATDDAVRRSVLGNVGEVCPVEDSDRYARALEGVLAEDWGQRPRRRAEEFSFATTAGAYAALLEELARGRESGGRAAQP